MSTAWNRLHYILIIGVFCGRSVHTIHTTKPKSAPFNSQKITLKTRQICGSSGPGLIMATIYALQAEASGPTGREPKRSIERWAISVLHKYLQNAHLIHCLIPKIYFSLRFVDYCSHT